MAGTPETIVFVREPIFDKRYNHQTQNTKYQTQIKGAHDAVNLWSYNAAIAYFILVFPQEFC